MALIFNTEVYMQITTRIASIGKGLRSIYLPIIYIVLQLTLTYHFTKNSLVQLDYILFFVFVFGYILMLYFLSMTHFQTDIRVFILDGLAIPAGWLLSLAFYLMASEHHSINDFLAGYWHLFALFISALALYISATSGVAFILSISKRFEK
ncbi:hypothetical protein HV009_16760 [Escherichia coli]|nr:hypothetical protein HV009_16760 [Escherichia coli]